MIVTPSTKRKSIRSKPARIYHHGTNSIGSRIQMKCTNCKKTVRIHKEK